MSEENKKEEMEAEVEVSSESGETSNTEEIIDAEVVEPEVVETESEEGKFADESDKPKKGSFWSSRAEEQKNEEDNRKFVKQNFTTKTGGVNLGTAIVVIAIAIGVIFFIFIKEGSWIMDPSEWSEYGWAHRSYVYVELESAAQADQSAGFSLSTPEEISGLSHRSYWIIEDYIYDVRYSADEDSASAIVIHKCAKNDLEEADTNEYTQINVVEVDGIEVTEKGSDGLVQSVTWKDNNYYYQILTSEDAMLEPEYAESLIASIH